MIDQGDYINYDGMIGGIFFGPILAKCGAISIDFNWTVVVMSAGGHRGSREAFGTWSSSTLMWSPNRKQFKSKLNTVQNCLLFIGPQTPRSFEIDVFKFDFM